MTYWRFKPYPHSIAGNALTTMLSKRSIRNIYGSYYLFPLQSLLTIKCISQFWKINTVFVIILSIDPLTNIFQTLARMNCNITNAKLQVVLTNIFSPTRQCTLYRFHYYRVYVSQVIWKFVVIAFSSLFEFYRNYIFSELIFAVLPNITTQISIVNLYVPNEIQL